MDEELRERINNMWSGDVKIVNPAFSHYNNTLSATILYREHCNYSNIEKEFQKIVNEYLEQEINYDLLLVQSFSDNEAISYIKELLSKYTTGSLELFCDACVEEDVKGKTIKLTSTREIDAVNANNIKSEILDSLKAKSIENYRISFITYGEKNSTNDDFLLNREKAILAQIPEAQEIKDPVYQVEISHIIYGNKITNMARKICTLHSEEQGILIAGKVEYFRENYYTKKDKPDEQKIRYNFELDDGTQKISAVFFPPKKLLEKGEFKLEDGQEIIVYCDVSLYKENLSIKVRELAECVLPELKTEEKDEDMEEEKGEISYITEVSDKYNLVEPKPYVELAQMDMFSLTNSVPNNLIGKDFVVFDLETTGFDYTMCDIIEIGAVKVRDGKIIESFTTLLRPRKSIPKEITELTGISDDMVVFAPTFREVVADFYKFTRGATMVAHNANFDMPFLRYHASNLRYNFDNEVLDTLAMARRLVKGVKNYKLKTLTEYFNIILIDAHRALNDTVATAKVFIELRKLEKDEK